MSVGLRISNLAIRTKILLSFVTVLILLGGLGLNALQRSSVMDRAIQNITGDYALALVYLDDMRVSLSDYRGNIARELLQGDDKTALQNTASVLTGLVKIYDENDAKYAPTVDPGTEATLYVEVKASWSAYLAMSRHFHELLAVDKAMEAKTYFFSDLAPAGARTEAAVHANMAYNIAAMNRLTREVDESYATGRLYIIGFMIIAAIMAILAGQFLVRSIAVPVHSMTEVMRRLAARDMTVELPAQGRSDEIGKMAQAVQVFKDSMIAADRLAGEKEAENEAKQRRATQLNQVVAGFEATAREMAGLLSSGATELEATARAMTGSADRTNQQASAVAAAAEQAGAGAQTVAAATEELTASINEISRQVAQSAKMAGLRSKGRAAHQHDRLRPLGGSRQDRQRSRLDHRYSRTDQPARAQRHDRGGARRRCGQGVCGGGFRSEELGQSDRPGHRGNWRPDLTDPGCDPGGRRGHSRHRYQYRGSKLDRHLDRLSGRGTRGRNG